MKMNDNKLRQNGTLYDFLFAKNILLILDRSYKSKEKSNTLEMKVKFKKGEILNIFR